MRFHASFHASFLLPGFNGCNRAVNFLAEQSGTVEMAGGFRMQIAKCKVQIEMAGVLVDLISMFRNSALASFGQSWPVFGRYLATL
jgi:hypothetical protein